MDEKILRNTLEAIESIVCDYEGDSPESCIYMEQIRGVLFGTLPLLENPICRGNGNDRKTIH